VQPTTNQAAGITERKDVLLSGEPRAQAWQQVISTAPQYANYQKKTNRQIPLIFLHPKT
jgi:hypothetical protein